MIGPIPVTNTLIGTWISIIALVIFFLVGTRRQDMIPTGAQNVAEWAVESLLNLVEGVVGKEKGRKFFPLVATFFIFILFCNVLDVFPFILPAFANVIFIPLELFFAFVQALIFALLTLVFMEIATTRERETEPEAREEYERSEAEKEKEAVAAR